MEKNNFLKKFYFIIILLLIVVGVTNLVEAKQATNSITVEIDEDKSNQNNKEINQNENRNRVQTLKDETNDQVGAIRQESKERIQAMVETAKQARSEFVNEVKTIRQETLRKAEEVKAQFREGLNKIKNEAKKNSTEKIINSINELNIRLTKQLSDKINQIENVIVGIESRIIKGEEKGLDLVKVKDLLTKSKGEISKSKDAILLQSQKIYTVTITDESTLKTKTQETRNLFKSEIKIARDSVVKAHEAVRDAAILLGEISDIDDEEAETEEEKVIVE